MSALRFTPLRIDAVFPGGNILVDRIEGDDVYVRQDLRDTEGWWFYWALRLRGAAGRRLRFHFTNKACVGTRGPAVSLDGGVSWSWQDWDFTGDGFEFAAPADAQEIRLAFGMVYTQVCWERFLAGLEPSPYLRPGTLATSRKGRAVEMLQAGRADDPRLLPVLVTVRHHACEMMANYALEGLLQALLADLKLRELRRESGDCPQIAQISRRLSAAETSLAD